MSSPYRRPSSSIMSAHKRPAAVASAARQQPTRKRLPDMVGTSDQAQAQAIVRDSATMTRRRPACAAPRVKSGQGPRHRGGDIISRASAKELSGAAAHAATPSAVAAFQKRADAAFYKVGSKRRSGGGSQVETPSPKRSRRSSNASGEAIVSAPLPQRPLTSSSAPLADRKASKPTNQRRPQSATAATRCRGDDGGQKPVVTSTSSASAAVARRASSSRDPAPSDTPPRRQTRALLPLTPPPAALPTTLKTVSARTMHPEEGAICKAIKFDATAEASNFLKNEGFVGSMCVFTSRRDAVIPNKRRILELNVHNAIDEFHPPRLVVTYRGESPKVYQDKVPLWSFEQLRDILRDLRSRATRRLSWVLAPEAVAARSPSFWWSLVAWGLGCRRDGLAVRGVDIDAPIAFPVHMHHLIAELLAVSEKSVSLEDAQKSVDAALRSDASQ
eukprot:TRINITY_DN63312_c0_g1_i1.p1 TRINITY_DN63312_c0_g1~~TRINITY_DN63312_c0_g1_i1.p1  ORF type:complete len:445 (+),score=64.96 TRINITY_DN63312_c0_g1_i1:66-1400(+)